MQLCTTSETISFAKDLEERSAEFYQAVSDRFEPGKEFIRFKEENRKFAVQIQRAYQSVITDAIEGCFAFKLESGDYAIDTELPEEISFEEAVKKAREMETRIVAFYNTAADQSMALMADIPRNFKIVVKKRTKRMDFLKSIA